MPEHGIELMEFLDSAGDAIHGDAKLISQTPLGGFVMGKKLVQGRIEEADRGGETAQSAEDSGKIRALFGKELGQGLASFFHVLGQNHLPDVIDSCALKEHMFGAAQSNALSTERHRMFDLVGLIGIGADIQLPALVGPLHQLGKEAVGRAI